MKGWEDRLWSKVDKTEDGCWLWTAHITPKGYGRFWDGVRLVGPHRLIYELLVEPLPQDVQLDHRPTCPKRCVNPQHLRRATNKQNGENRAGAYANSKSGVRGVHWDEKRLRWCAYVMHNYKSIFAGRFKTLEEAEAAVVAKRLELFTHNETDRMADA